MALNQFNWEDSKQFNAYQVLLAFALPSAFAYAGFHGMLPALVARGVPSIVAWPMLASLMISILVVIAVWRMSVEARQLGVSVKDRMCLKSLSSRQWFIFMLVIVVGLALAAAAGQLVEPFMKMTGLTVPDYMPFFLNPAIDPMQASSDVLSPGYPLKGQVMVLVLFMVALLMIIFAEELYFRAWLLPKMSRYGRWGWFMNAVLFALYHTFQFWLFPTILAGSLVWAFVIYRSKSIYPALLGHFIGSFLLSVLGLAVLVFS